MSISNKKGVDSAAIIHQLRQRVYELEMDLEHAITQCKKIAAKKTSSDVWINREQPKLER